VIELVERPEWMLRANCRGLNPDQFHPERGASNGAAKAVCAGCTVRQDCLDYALDNGEKHGVWGGLSERERRRIRGRRPAATRLCQWAPCQRSFTPTNGSQVYCTPGCQAAAASARKVPSRRVG
jgi:WhiB family redox-sensing transcriptional regulator